MARIILIALLMVSTLAQPAWAEEKDPFKPYLFEPKAATDGAVEQPKENTQQVRPLNDLPLTAYKVVGLVVSPKQALVVIQDPDRREFFLTIGDLLGSEGGVIESIAVDGITVDTRGDLVTLKVSNKFELQNDKK